MMLGTQLVWDLPVREGDPPIREMVRLADLVPRAGYIGIRASGAIMAYFHAPWEMVVWTRPDRLYMQEDERGPWLQISEMPLIMATFQVHLNRSRKRAE